MEPIAPLHRLYDPAEVHQTERIRKPAENPERERQDQRERRREGGDPFEVDTFEPSEPGGEKEDR